MENDNLDVMVLGALWCPFEKARIINVRLKEIKLQHQLSNNFEIKWTKVSNSKIDFYMDLINYFFDNNDLHFRALVIPDKSKLKHDAFCQTHDDWYYKMYFTMLKTILNPGDRYYIYIDIKDTKGSEKIKNLHEILSNSKLDFQRQIIKKMQLVRSHEISILQLADLLIGAVSYKNRGLNSNKGKTALVDKIIDRSGYDLTKSTLYLENKVNILNWIATEEVI